MSIRLEESHILLLLNVVYINFDSEDLIVNVKTTNVIAAILNQHKNPTSKLILTRNIRIVQATVVQHLKIRITL